MRQASARRTAAGSTAAGCRPRRSPSYPASWWSPRPDRKNPRHHCRAIRTSRTSSGRRSSTPARARWWTRYRSGRRTARSTGGRCRCARAARRSWWPTTRAWWCSMRTTREELASIELPPKGPYPEPELVWDTVWTPDGSRLLLGVEGNADQADDGGLAVVDPATWEVERRVSLGRGPGVMEFSPDGGVLVAGVVSLDQRGRGAARAAGARRRDVRRRRGGGAAGGRLPGRPGVLARRQVARGGR